MMTRADLEYAYDEVLAYHGVPLEDIVWTTMDGRKIEIGKINHRHLESIIAYFNRIHERMSVKASILNEEIDENPESFDIKSFIEDLETAEGMIKQAELVVFIMKQERTRRRKKNLQSSPVMAKMRAKLRQNELAHMRRVSS